MTQTSTQQTYTVEEFVALYGNSKTHELIRGELREVNTPAMAGEEHGRIGAILLTYLGIFVLQNKLGQHYGSDTSFQIMPGTLRMPDVAFVKAERVIRGSGYIPIPPDLAVEIVSPNDTWDEVEDKIELYLQAGVSLIWAIRPSRKRVYIYRPNNQQPEIVDINGELDGGQVLPGFKLKVSQLFD